MSNLATKSNESTERKVIIHTRGKEHGDITRLFSPGDLGELLKPFIFLDSFTGDPLSSPVMGMHPHSGIITVTLLKSGQIKYKETTGAEGILHAGDVEWMQAGNGVWHSAELVGEEMVKGLQLWLALSPELENAPSKSFYVKSSEIKQAGPARVIIGNYQGVQSTIPTNNEVNYLDINMFKNNHWSYTPPPEHNIAWATIHEGSVEVQNTTYKTGDVIVFAEGNESIEFTAIENATFVLGSAVKHQHDLITGYYSVHTSEKSLMKGEAEINRIKKEVLNKGRN